MTAHEADRRQVLEDGGRRRTCARLASRYDPDDRKIVGVDVASVEFGWPIGMPTCRPLRGGLYEVRSTIHGGKVETRVYFTIDGDRMVLLHAQTGKDGQQDAIKLARARLAGRRGG